MRALAVLCCFGAFLLADPLRAEEHRLLRLGGYNLKWGTPGYGEPTTVTYAPLKTAAQFPDAINCRSLRPWDTLEIGPALDLDAVRQAVNRAAAMWAEVADVRLRRAVQSERADILFGVQGEPRGVAFTNVWYETDKAADGIAPLSRATICVNPEIAWSVVPDGNEVTYDLRTVMAHEFGHAIGLDHPGAEGPLMAYRYQEGVQRPRAPDIAGAARLYGTPAGGFATGKPEQKGRSPDIPDSGQSKGG